MQRTILFVVLGTLVCLPSFTEGRGIGGTAGGSPQGPQKYAVIIGVNEYQDPGISDLKYAAADARAVYEMLKSAPGGFNERRIVLLADTQDEQHDPTLGNILRYLKTYVALAGPDDTILVYFAGHGTAIDDRLYLLPTDASLALVKELGIAFTTLKKMLEDSPAKRRILLLDACHSGAGRSIDTLGEDAFKRLAQESEGTVVLSSCGPNELSHEMAELGHGAFTYFLLDGLTGKADTNGDGLVGASELSTFTWENTRLWAADKGLIQNPWRMERVSGEIILTAKGGVIPQTQGQSTEPEASEVGSVAVPGEAGRRTYCGGRFIDNGDGTILDTKTSLLWQKADSQVPVSIKGAGMKLTVPYVAFLDLAGRHDWRVPTIPEWRGLAIGTHEAGKMPFVNSGDVYWAISKRGFVASRFSWAEDDQTRVGRGAPVYCRAVTSDAKHPTQQISDAPATAQGSQTGRRR